MLFNLLLRNLVTLFMIPLFSFKLWSRRSFRDTETKFFRITVLSCLILVAEDILEGITSMDRSLRFWRILLSALGYNFRTTAAVGLLLILWNVIRNFSEKNGKEKYIPSTCALFCLAATAADATAGGSHLIVAIMISSVFFYIVLYSHDNRRDTLTGLLNRRAFYNDCINYRSSVTAVASLDMNGLKELNDTYGHQAGNEALIGIGRCIDEAVGHSIQAYRVGGDEFILLSFSGNTENIAEAIDRIKDGVTASGYHISVGYTAQSKDLKLENAIKEADRLMYDDKARYYQESGKNRRRR